MVVTVVPTFLSVAASASSRRSDGVSAPAECSQRAAFAAVCLQVGDCYLLLRRQRQHEPITPYELDAAGRIAAGHTRVAPLAPAPTHIGGAERRGSEERIDVERHSLREQPKLIHTFWAAKFYWVGDR